MCRRLLRRSAGALLATLCGLGLARTAAAQVPPADPSDVGTVDGIVRAYYDVINGPPGAPRQWRRDSTLYMPEVRFVAMSEHDGKPKADVLTPEQFRRAVDADFIKHGFYEVEIGRRTERFGNVVQVRSAYDTRRAPKAPSMGRGVNYLTLYWDGARWWISAAAWDDERPGNPMPAPWIGSHETAP